MRPACGGASCRIGVPILPPSWVSYPACAHKMRDQRRGGRFAVGAGDHYQRSVGRMGAPLAAEQLDVADHLDRHGLGEPDRPVRRRMGERHAGRKHQRRDPAPVEIVQVGDRNAGAGRILDTIGAVVPADDVGAAGKQRAGGDQPGTAEAEDRDLAARECGGRDHVCNSALRRTMIKPIAAALSLPIFGEGAARLRAGWGEPRNAVPGKDPTLPSIRNRTRPISAPNMSNSATAEFDWTGREKRAAPLRLIASSSQLQCGQARQRQDDGDDPEPDHDLRLGPADLLEMVMDRRHPEYALAGQLE